MNHAQYINQSNLQKISEHISYEIEMLNFSAEKLAKGNLNQAEINVFLENFLLHARCIIDFLYVDGVVHSDDVIAKDFFIDVEAYLNRRPQISESLENLKRRAGKELAHLTYARLKVTPEIKAWQVFPLWKKINNVLGIFFKCLTDEQRGWFRVIAISQ